MTAERSGAAWTGAAGELLADRGGEPDGASHADSRDLIRVYLQPGQLYASGQASAVTTVLGSCVAICLWDPLVSVGGMNHYLLPFFAGAGKGSPRFGNVAVAQLVDRLVALGASRTRLQAKVFGGACVLEAFQARQGHLGEKNAGVAFKLLDELGIPVVSRDVGGRSGRKLIFHTDLGNAWVAKL
jgi:chemotaxis protein CheD